METRSRKPPHHDERERQRPATPAETWEHDDLGKRSPAVSVEQEMKSRDAGGGLQRGQGYRGEVDEEETEEVDEKSPRRA